MRKVFQLLLIVVLVVTFAGCGQKQPLDVTIQGQGRVTQSVSAAGISVEKGTVVGLLAVPAAGWRFDHWEGALTGSENPKNIEMTEPKQVTAVFIQLPVAYDSLVTINAAGDTFAACDGSLSQSSQSLSYNYQIGRYEVCNEWFALFIADGGYTTQDYWTTSGWQWKTTNNVTGPAFWTDSNLNASNQPVVGVSWYEAVAFCNWLSVKNGFSKPYDVNGQIVSLTQPGYRLPTEMEWNYAACKGETGASQRTYAWGNSWDSSKAVTSHGIAATKPAAIGSRNGDTPQGVADMTGNVSEWVSDQRTCVTSGSTDWYYYGDSTSGYDNVCKGGSWKDNTLANLTTGYRCIGAYLSPYSTSDSTGFRIVFIQ